MILKKLVVLCLFCLALSACKSDAERAEEAYQRGMQLLQAGDGARARVEFRNAIAVDMNHVGAQLQIGRLAYLEGNNLAAFRSYGRVYETDANNLEAVIALARITFLQQQWEEFDRFATRAQELAPADPVVTVITLAHDYRKAALAKDAEAQKRLVARAETLATGPDAEIMLRFVLIDGYLDAARYDLARTQVDAAIAQQPTNPTLHPIKLQVLAQLGDLAGIETELRRVIAVFPQEKAYKAALLRFLVGRGELDKAEAYLRDEAAPETLAKLTKEEEKTAPVVDLVQFLNQFRGPDPALAELDSRLATQPQANGLRALRAALNFGVGKRDAAIAEMEALVALDTLAPAERQGIKVALAGMLARTGNEVGARRLVEEVLQADPGNAEALKIKANWLIDEDNTAEAITALRAALASSPQDTEILTLMARAHERAGNTNLMLESLSLAVDASKNAPAESLRYAQALIRQKRFDQADSTLVAALRLVPDDVTLLSTLGQVHLSRDNLTRAREVQGKLAAIASEPARQAASDLELQLIEREKGSDRALDYLSALAGSNEDDRIKLALIRAQLMSGKTREALDYVNQLLATKPDNFSYRYFHALTLAASADYPAAETELAALVKEQPTQPQPWLQLARVRAITTSADAMSATIDEGLKTIPASADLLWAKASVLERKGDIDGAIAIYETLYARDSSSVVIANNLASLLATYRNDPESLARAETIARRLKTADAPPLQETYGWILFRNGKAAEALPYVEPAAKVLANDPTVQVHLGLIYHALGRKDEAQAQLDLARKAAGATPPAAVSDSLATLEKALAAPAP